MNSQFEHGGTVFAVARELGAAPESILDFSASINPLGPSVAVRAAVAGAFDRVVHYPESGAPELCRALASYHELPVAMLAAANGSTELIHLLPRLNSTGRRVLLIAPTFSEYGHALELAGWQIDYLCLSPADGFSLDPAAVAASLAHGYDLLICCNPGNPTGRLYQPAEVAALYQRCHEAGCFFVLDEAFIDFAEESSAKRLLPAENADWLILRSMTKFFGFPGLRLGYGLASPTVIARLQRLLPPWSVGVLAQAAALAALADSEHCSRTRAFVGAERQRLAERLSRIPGLEVFAGAANYLLLRIDAAMTAAGLQARLLPERILIRNCGNFVGLDERFFRVAVRTCAENDRLLAALAEAFESCI